MTSPVPLGDRRFIATSAMGATQILAWGSSFYLPAVLAPSISAEMGWSISSVVGGLSVGLLVSGLCSPFVGRAVHRHGGRRVLAYSSFLLALALSCLSVSTSYAAYVGAWLVMGLGMSCGLYDAAFGTAGRLYGTKARSVITTLTLWGGFASTVCWPFSAYLVETVGWRDACLVYAAIHLLVGLPLHLFAVPRAVPLISPEGDMQPRAAGEERRGQTRTFVLLATILTCAALISSMVSVHLLTVLQLRGFDLAMAVALGALVGPSQVAARIIDMAVGVRFHPVWTMLMSVSLVGLGMVLLLARLPLPALALILYGAGNGIHTIARGALPLVLFSPDRYALFMGRLALPSLLVQALSPWLGAELLGGDGSPMLALLTVVAGINVALCWLLIKRRAL